MNNKPFWQGKTCKEMAGLHVKVTFNSGTIVTGVTNMNGDITEADNLSGREGNEKFVPYDYVKSIELLDDPEYERIDNIEDVRKGDVRDSDFILNGESFYCPQCGRHLKAATGTVKGSEEKRYRFKCVDRMHYRTKWHESYQAALMEMIETFEKGENA